MAGPGQGLVVKQRALALLLLALVAGGCQRAPKPGPTLREKAKQAVKKKIEERLPQIEVNAPHLTEYDKNQKRWELKGQSITSRPQSREVVFAGVNVVFFEQEKPTLRVRAPRAVLHTKSRNLDLLGGVRAEFVDEKTAIAAPWLRYRHKTREVVCDGDVRVWGKAGLLRASGLVASLPRQRITLQRGVDMELGLGAPP